MRIWESTSGDTLPQSYMELIHAGPTPRFGAISKPLKLRRMRASTLHCPILGLSVLNFRTIRFRTAH
jgi:hypothetical protein